MRQHASLDETMVRWFRGQATVDETTALFDAGFIRLTSGKVYRHYIATAKGRKAADRFYRRITTRV